LTGATKEGTEAFVARSVRGDVVREHFREVEGWKLSTIGFGTYLGEADDATDELYFEALLRAAEMGCNFWDTASTYRCQRSERTIGRALRELAERGVGREEIVLATKGGYIAFDGEPPGDTRAYLEKRFLAPAIFRAEDVAGGSHVLAPSFLADQLDQSRENLGVETLDIYYLHNPEAQLGSVDRATLRARLLDAMAFLEEAVAGGKIRFYGTATWNGYRVGPDARDFLSLAEVIDLAKEVGGESHHCRFVQAPHNLAMTESFSTPNQPVGDDTLSLCQAAELLGIHLVSSASIAQGRLTQGLPDWLGTLFKGFETDAQRALQFVRSTPGVTAALVGMKSSRHVRENLAVAQVAPASIEDFMKLFEVDASE